MSTMVEKNERKRKLPRSNLRKAFGPHRQSYYWSFLLFVSLLSILPPASQSQQSASLNIPFYTSDYNYSLRQNVCDRAQKYNDGIRDNLGLRHALEGFQMNVAAGIGMYFHYSNNTLNEEYPGLMAVLLDELARRGKFTWRDSFAVFDGPGVNHTWTELLLFTSNYFDLSAEWWVENLARFELGIAFPKGWYDASFIFVTASSQDKNPEINMHGWLKPFQPEVWIMIGFTMIWSGMIYMFIEYLECPTQYTGRRAQESFGNDLYSSAILFTQHLSFNPKTPASRILVFSMSFWALLISSAYTANLASFFVDESNHKYHVTTIEDAIRLSKPICVHESTVHAVYVQENYPAATYIKLKNEEELYTSVQDGICPLAVTTVTSFRDYASKKETNADCRLVWTGNVIKPSMAGFAAKVDSGRKCTSLIHDVLNLHMREMEADGFLGNAWNEHYARVSDNVCDNTSSDNEYDLEMSQRRSIYEMGGTFVFHFAISLFAVLLALFTKISKVHNNRQSMKQSQSLPPTWSELDKEAKSSTLALEVNKGNDGDGDNKSCSTNPSTTFFQDLLTETPSVRMRRSVCWSSRYRLGGGGHHNNANATPATGVALDNLDMLDILQQEFQQQQEEMEEKFLSQQVEMEQRMKEQIATIMQDQFTAMMAVLREETHQKEKEIVVQPGLPSNQGQIMSPNVEPLSKDGEVAQSSLLSSGPSPSAASTTTTTTGGSRAATRRHGVATRRASHKTRLRLKGHQITPALLNPHADEDELRGALSQHIDFPEEANSIRVKLVRKVKAAAPEKENH